MPTGFEVGKKYRVTTGSLTVYECMYVSTHLAVLKAPGGGEFATTPCTWHSYKEFIEPRREFWNAYKDSRDETWYRGPYNTRMGCDNDLGANRDRRYGVLELIHHSETRIESVFHMVAKK